jgi:hypothetical protein
MNGAPPSASVAHERLEEDDLTDARLPNEIGVQTGSIVCGLRPRRRADSRRRAGERRQRETNRPNRLMHGTIIARRSGRSHQDPS